MTAARHVTRPIARWWRGIGAEAARDDRPVGEVLTGDHDIDAIIRSGFAGECRRLDRLQATQQERPAP